MVNKTIENLNNRNIDIYINLKIKMSTLGVSGAASRASIMTSIWMSLKFNNVLSKSQL